MRRIKAYPKNIAQGHWATENRENLTRIQILHKVGAVNDLSSLIDNYGPLIALLRSSVACFGVSFGDDVHITFVRLWWLSAHHLG